MSLKYKLFQWYWRKITYPLKPFFDFPASEVFDVEVDFPEASPLTFSPDSENIKEIY